jgi:hypothetical protein
VDPCVREWFRTKTSILLTIPALFVSYATRNSNAIPLFKAWIRTVHRPFNQESTDPMNNKLKPAIIGGVVLGILSVIPFVNWVNVCCCLWAILGGLLAAHLYVKGSPTPASTGDGAIVGALAGLVGAVIAVIIGIPISILMSGVMTGVMVSIVEGINPAQAEMMREQMIAGQTVAGAIVNGLILAVFLVIFSTLGGLLGIAIFEKRKGGAPPPPAPQNFGGAGGYGSPI